MPLTKRQFELGIDTEGENLIRQVYDLLAAHAELAYSLKELESAVLGHPTPVTKLGKFRQSVEVLVGIGAVEQRDVGDTDYYAILHEFDTGTWLSKRVPFKIV